MQQLQTEFLGLFRSAREHIRTPTSSDSSATKVDLGRVTGRRARASIREAENLPRLPPRWSVTARWTQHSFHCGSDSLAPAGPVPRGNRLLELTCAELQDQAEAPPEEPDKGAQTSKKLKGAGKISSKAAAQRFQMFSHRSHTAAPARPIPALLFGHLTAVERANEHKGSAAVTYFIAAAR